MKFKSDPRDKNLNFGINIVFDDEKLICDPHKFAQVPNPSLIYRYFKPLHK